MSTASAPYPRPTAPRPSPPRRRPAPQRVPTATPAPRPARAPFVGAVLVLLVLGLGALLLLNTLLAQGSFTLHSLDARIADLSDKEQSLQQRVAELAAPQRLARRASAIGMVPSENPAFLRASDGKVLGVPVPASSPAPVVESEPVPATPEADPQDKQSDKQSDRQQDKQQDKKQDKPADDGQGGSGQ